MTSRSSTATATRITCSDCGCTITDPQYTIFQLCPKHLDGWFNEACAVAPRTFHPTSHDINRIVAKHAAIGSAIRAQDRYDGDTSKPYAQHVRDEANQDCEDALTPVQCSECPRVYRMDDVPDGDWYCPACVVPS